MEAVAQIEMGNKHDMSEPEFWANLLSALVNSNMAAASDEVMLEVDFLNQRAKTQRKVQSVISEKLSKSK